MAEPTLKDVLNAIARLEKGQAELRAETASKKDLVAFESRVDKDLVAFESRVDKRFDRVDAAIAELDADVERHMKVHKDIDKRIEAIKPRPTTARMPRRR